MKGLRLILGLATLISSAFATSYIEPKKTFEEFVSEADHIVIGKVLSVIMRDKNGNQVRDLKARTEPHSGNVITIRLSVGKADILKTNSKKFPEIITYDLWRSLVLELGGMKDMEGHSFIVLLEKVDFQPHASTPFDFMWPLDLRDKVVKVIEAKKEPKKSD